MSGYKCKIGTMDGVAILANEDGSCAHCGQRAITARHFCRADSQYKARSMARSARERRQNDCKHASNYVGRNLQVYCQDCGADLGYIGELADLRDAGDLH